ncbi:hypothetical protein DRQ53_04245 [bacterium]|nr:MAG: hypothetical protein DRQ32_07435 [bacterium]RKZ17186.1 MAG: hypothetical protein DRQ53_04245 [bacterium]
MNGEEGLSVVGIVEDKARRALHIDLSDGSSLELAIDADEARELNPGLVLSAEQGEGLRVADERKRAARQVFRWLDRRARTRADLQRRLYEKGYSQACIGGVLDGFEKQGLVDDRAFAERFGLERLRNRPVGPRWLHGRLRQEGIDGEVVRSVVAGLFAAHDESELALRALRGRRIDCTQEAGRQKAARFLNSRGFGNPASIEAIQTLRAEVD